MILFFVKIGIETNVLLHCIAAIPFLFIVFIVYEKWEDEIDGVVHNIWSRTMKLKANVTKKPIKQH